MHPTPDDALFHSEAKITAIKSSHCGDLNKRWSPNTCRKKRCDSAVHSVTSQDIGLMSA